MKTSTNETVVIHIKNLQSRSTSLFKAFTHHRCMPHHTPFCRWLFWPSFPLLVHMCPPRLSPWHFTRSCCSSRQPPKHELRIIIIFCMYGGLLATIHMDAVSNKNPQARSERKPMIVPTQPPARSTNLIPHLYRELCQPSVWTSVESILSPRTPPTQLLNVDIAPELLILFQ